MSHKLRIHLKSESINLFKSLQSISKAFWTYFYEENQFLSLEKKVSSMHDLLENILAEFICFLTFSGNVWT